MAHTPHTWTTGDTITAALMNALEIDLAALGNGGSYTDEQAQDAVAAAFAAGTLSGLTLTYDDVNNRINVTVTRALIGLGNVDNTADVNKPISTAQALVNAAKADLVGGVIPTAQIPSIAVIDYLGTAANQAAMLALVGQKGDWTIRTDLATTWVITGSDPTQLSNWTALGYPTAPVQSVAGKTGVVTLGPSDVGADPAGAAAAVTKTTLGLSTVDNTSDLSKPLSTAATAALAGKKSTIVQQATQTASFNAAAGNFYPVNASSGNVTVTLPTSTAGQEIQLKKLDANAASGATSGIVNVTGTINGTTSATVPLRKQGMGKQYLADGSGGWTVVLGDLDITQLGATTTEQGFVILAGDLGGTSSAPTVPGLAAKAPLASPTFTGQPKIGTSPIVKASDLPQQYNTDGLLLTPVDGGVQFFRKFRFPFRTDPYFFPLGLHFPAITAASDVATHLSAGINYYHWLTSTSDLSLLQGGTLPAVLQWKDWGATYTSWQNNGAVAGISLDDERDMVYNGSGGDQTQGYADQQTQLDTVTKDGRFVHANYSKGVAFYGTDPSAARYVNDFTDTVSMDVYWMTDLNTLQQFQGGKYVNGATAPITQAQAQMGYLYGAIVNRVRSLVSPTGAKPMFNCVELGHTAGDTTSPTITAAQINSAAWHSIIAGARGIIYIDQAFTTGNAISDADIVKNQPAVRTALATTNALITKLAPAINSPTVTGFCSVPTGVVATVKWYNGAYYVIAGSSQTASQSASFTLNVAGYITATVVGESRSVTVTSNAFSDTFADQNAIHIYKLAKG